MELLASPTYPVHEVLPFSPSNTNDESSIGTEIYEVLPTPLASPNDIINPVKWFTL